MRQSKNNDNKTTQLFNNKKKQFVTVFVVMPFIADNEIFVKKRMLPKLNNGLCDHGEKR